MGYEVRIYLLCITRVLVLLDNFRTIECLEGLREHRIHKVILESVHSSFIRTRSYGVVLFKYFLDLVGMSRSKSSPRVHIPLGILREVREGSRIALDTLHP